MTWLSVCAGRVHWFTLRSLSRALCSALHPGSTLAPTTPPSATAPQFHLAHYPSPASFSFRLLFVRIPLTSAQIVPSPPMGALCHETIGHPPDNHRQKSRFGPNTRPHYSITLPRPPLALSSPGSTALRPVLLATTLRGHLFLTRTVHRSALAPTRQNHANKPRKPLLKTRPTTQAPLLFFPPVSLNALLLPCVAPTFFLSVVGSAPLCPCRSLCAAIVVSHTNHQKLRANC